MRALLLALALLACDEGEDEPSPSADSEERAALPAEAFFPLREGDRWRIEGSDGTVRLEGVTGVDDRGIAAVHGTGHSHVERYLEDEEGVFVVTPAGRRLSPVLRPPIAAGATFEYTLEERDVRVRCEVELGSIDGREEIAGRTVEPCVSLTRRCSYPAGAPFPTETAHTRDEVYCRGLGLVSERGVFRPAPSPGAMASDRRERVVGFRVAGGPEPPADGCARYILLPSDVAAACGPSVRAAEGSAGVGQPSHGTGCGYGLTHGTARLRAVVGAPESDAPDDALVVAREGAAAAWLEGAPEACRDPARLAPLLGSLLR